MNHTRAKRILTVLPAMLVLGFLSVFSSPIQAANGSDFNAGRIIDDAVFFDKSSMSAQDIQNWLNDMLDGNPSNGVNKTCDTNGTKMQTSTQTRAQWAVANGYPGPPYICVRDYIENPDTKQNNYSGSVPGGISAAQIIWNVSQQFNINPRVLLVLIQKESVGGMLTDDWPFASQYRTIAGYACPDGQPCDSQYFGFYNQMYNAARQFRLYANNPGNYNYVAGTNNNILYHPSNPCGYQTVFIQNQATAGLYNYTPYVPNTAALNNLYGTGDGCSSYGNRNFWRFWTDWFGSTYTPAHAWSIESQTYSKGSTQINSTDKETITLRARNTGSVTWTNSGPNPVRLGTDGPIDRSSNFYDPSWGSPGRPATLAEATVAPGEVGTFTFTVQAPAPGTYQERFNLVREGIAWFNNPGMYFTFTVNPATYAAQYVSDTFPATLGTGATASVTVTYKNNSNTSWFKTGFAPVKLGTKDHNNAFADSSWQNAARAAVMNESSVAPGGNATFTFTIKAPPVAGSYTDSFQPVVEGWAWINAPVSKTLEATGTYYASTATPSRSITVIAGETISQSLTFTNTGSATWVNSGFPQLKLGTSAPYSRSSAFRAPSWPDSNRLAVMNEASVASGATGSFNFNLKAPLQPGTYTEVFAPVAEGLVWVPTNVTYTINVVPASYTWSLKSQVYSNGSINMSPGQIATLTVTATNTGNKTWTNNGDFPVKLAPVEPRDRNSSFYHGSWPSSTRAAVLQEASVAPGSDGTFTFQVRVPGRGGLYKERFSLIAEGVAWFNDPGMYFTISVNSNYQWQIVSQSYSTGTPIINRGQTATLTVVAKNTGDTTWFNSGDFQLRLGTTNPRNRLFSPFYHSSWISQIRPAVMQEASVTPGSNGTFSFTIQAPQTAGIYQEYSSLVAEGITWLNDPGMYFYLDVR